MSSRGTNAVQLELGERRLADRYPVDVDLSYKILGTPHAGDSGFGRVVNLSSNGLIAECQPALQAGLDVELVITWPAQHGKGVGIKLHATAHTVRTDGTRTGLRIDESAFRLDS